ncbi:unnamed protein product [Ranitomeya imitator]|uniref:Reverse transcriptase domain-containing protein n=1 Tax=Ranitomeya imitator TaxID=111125 RepID=A0ABN9MJ14_9NEOB|nr:unnamed protein product [Ranitomeya imitator]
MVLEENYFMFQDSFYVQQQGTAMGSNVVPPFAVAYMAAFEKDYVYSHPLFIEHCKIWWRYIDDIFCIWDRSIESLLTFDSHINNIWPELKFTVQHDTNRISFLDTLIYKEEGFSPKPNLKHHRTNPIRASREFHLSLPSILLSPPLSYFPLSSFELQCAGSHDSLTVLHKPGSSSIRQRPRDYSTQHDGPDVYEPFFAYQLFTASAFDSDTFTTHRTPSWIYSDCHGCSLSLHHVMDVFVITYTMNPLFSFVHLMKDCR